MGYKNSINTRSNIFGDGDVSSRGRDNSLINAGNSIL